MGFWEDFDEDAFMDGYENGGEYETDCDPYEADEGWCQTDDE